MTREVRKIRIVEHMAWRSGWDSLLAMNSLLRSSLSLCVILLSACAQLSESETQPLGEDLLSTAERKAALTGKVDFRTHVRPILAYRCAGCHNEQVMPGRMNLDNRKAALRTGALGNFIVPYHPEGSPIIDFSRSHDNIAVMPVVGVRATAEECDILAKWIEQGAHWPSGTAGIVDIPR